MRALAQVLIRHYAATIRAKSLERKVATMVRGRIMWFWNILRSATTTSIVKSTCSAGRLLEILSRLVHRR